MKHSKFFFPNFCLYGFLCSTHIDVRTRNCIFKLVVFEANHLVYFSFCDICEDSLIHFQRREPLGRAKKMKLKEDLLHGPSMSICPYSAP